MNGDIVDLGKWNEKTVQSIRRVIDGAKAAPIGYTILFVDHDEHGGEVYKFKTMLAGSAPENQEEKTRIKSALDFCSIFLEKVLNPERRKPH